jgi:hypothetical protein
MTDMDGNYYLTPAKSQLDADEAPTYFGSVYDPESYVVNNQLPEIILEANVYDERNKFGARLKNRSKGWQIFPKYEVLIIGD